MATEVRGLGLSVHIYQTHASLRNNSPRHESGLSGWMAQLYLCTLIALAYIYERNIGQKQWMLHKSIRAWCWPGRPFVTGVSHQSAVLPHGRHSYSSFFSHPVSMNCNVSLHMLKFLCNMIQCQNMLQNDNCIHKNIPFDKHWIQG